MFMYGHLEVFCGPMFAAKTTHLLRRVLWARSGLAKEVLVLKPAMDTRYSGTRIVSHDGLWCDAQPVNEFPETGQRYDLVAFDEIQFFTEPYFKGDVVETIRHILADGTDVVVAGLDMDWMGKPFDVTARLVAMADSVQKLHAHCTVCGQNAHKTLKRNQADASVSVELGAQDSYEARCNKHWITPRV